MFGTRPHFTREAIYALHGSRTIDGRRAARELSHRARPFEDTLRDAVAWFVQSGRLPALRARFAEEVPT